MPTNNFKIGISVYDTWWPWRVETIIKINKTNAHVRFPDRDDVYDKSHFQFLQMN